MMHKTKQKVLAEFNSLCFFFLRVAAKRPNIQTLPGKNGEQNPQLQRRPISIHFFYLKIIQNLLRYVQIIGSVDVIWLPILLAYAPIYCVIVKLLGKIVGENWYKGPYSVTHFRFAIEWQKKSRRFPLPGFFTNTNGWASQWSSLKLSSVWNMLNLWVLTFIGIGTHTKKTFPWPDLSMYLKACHFQRSKW